MSRNWGPGLCQDCGQHSEERHSAGRCSACHDRRAADRQRMYRDGPTALYRLYDEHGQLLYLGITGDPVQRWKDHAKAMPWWPEVTRRDVDWLPIGRNEAVRAERAALAAELPLYERNAMVLPDGCPPPPPHAHHPPRAEYWPAWFQWRALFRELQLNREERAALGR